MKSFFAIFHRTKSRNGTNGKATAAEAQIIALVGISFESVIWKCAVIDNLLLTLTRRASTVDRLHPATFDPVRAVRARQQLHQNDFSQDSDRFFNSDKVAVQKGVRTPGRYVG